MNINGNALVVHFGAVTRSRTGRRGVGQLAVVARTVQTLATICREIGSRVAGSRCRNGANRAGCRVTEAIQNLTVRGDTCSASGVAILWIENSVIGNVYIVCDSLISYIQLC